MTATAHLSLDEVGTLASTTLRANGISAEQTAALVDTITAAERDGCKSHGLFRVPGYIQSARNGLVNPQAVPTVHDLAPGVVHVDAGNGFAPLALKAGREPLAAKARSQGIAALGIINSCHIAALWPEVEALAEQGLIAMAFVTAASYVAPAGGTKPLYGTNPLAFAWPRPDGKPPLVFDQATSASARGEIQLHLRDGKPLPEGWAIDAEGNPTTDPAAALAGAQLTFGGYKGAALALMVELLAGALIGGPFSFEVSKMDKKDGGIPPRGEFIIAIDPNRCAIGSNGSATLAHAETLFSEILAQPGTRLPAERRYKMRAITAAEGIDIPQTLFEQIQQLGHA
jgi:LDH2 family malate/lactate/ureidoglycolate dehydrogenase